MRSFQIVERDPSATLEALLQDIQVVRDAQVAAGHREPWYYRGDKLPPDSELKPPIGREQKYGGRKLLLSEEQESKLLNRFRRFAYSHLPPGAGDWEALFLARHYNLPTRLMDWSVSPLVAAYFACTPFEDKPPDGVVWGILRQQEGYDVNVLKTNKGPFDLYHGAMAVKLIYPVYNSERISAQRGLFTWHSQPYVALDQQATVPFYDDKLDVQLLVKWPFAFGTGRRKFLEQLEIFGVSQRTIFPDLEGITRGLWQTEVLFNGEDIP